MQLQRSLSNLPGILDAGVVMATAANRDLLAESDLLVETDAGPDDLLIVVSAEDEQSGDAALTMVDELMLKRRRSGVQAIRPRSLSAAANSLAESQWVLISVPGRYAAAVARDALNLGKHVFLYSDNVPLEEEIDLKKQARDRGLLVMGPDCGTAIISGIGLGFANRVRRGNIGLVGASGTGLQAITSQIHTLGGGVSQAIGTGGRDLKAEVGAITAIQALSLLAKDPDTEVIVLVSKPPEPRVATELLQSALAIEKPVIVYFIGFPAFSRRVKDIQFASSLDEAAALAVEAIASAEDGIVLKEKNTGTIDGFVRGLFSGGTLAQEFMLGVQTVLEPVYSNVPIYESQRLTAPFQSKAHTVLDLGEDEFTQGRLHPMIDNDLRLRRLAQEATDADVSIIVFDIVLGEGAHRDPASEFVPVIKDLLRTAREEGRNLEIIAIVVGTDEDPQDIGSQIEQFQSAGVVIYHEIIEVVNHIATQLARTSIGRFPEVDLASFDDGFAGINVGLEMFYESLKAQGADAVHVEWRPPAGGNEKLMALLAKMK
jgi:FdrA protein